MEMKNTVILILLLTGITVNAQILSKIEPASWWVGMSMDTVEFMVYGSDIADLKAESKSLKIIGSESLDSKNYLFVTAVIATTTKTGSHKISFRIPNGKLKGALFVDILDRRTGSADRNGFSSADFVYLLMPDRFRNGDQSNDNVIGMEKSDRTKLGGRHGGDIEGVRLSLDYLQDLGVTGLWLNPVLENDMPDYSYHGYAMTNLYKVDERFGSNEDYQRLSSEAKQKGIGLIMDQVANHIGSHHSWMSDLPSEDWVNQWEDFTQTNHMKVSRFDIHAAEVDRKQFTDGWFVETMPDLNQAHPKLARYLIQNSIWWVEYLDLYGIRMDTWSYPNKEFLSNWTKAILEEYPNLNIVGEEWVSDPGLISYWQADAKRQDDYQSYLPSVMDFPLQTAIVEGLQGEEGWRSSMTKIYESLANDYKYGDVNNIMIFPDNHDMSRIFTQLEENFDHWKMAMSLYFTTRGTLQIFYGTEILMTNRDSDDHGVIRTDFPGGWQDDQVNAFSGKGLTSQQLEAQSWIKLLSKIRRDSRALHSGELLHYIPNSEVYVYFRSFELERIMVVANRNEISKELNVARYSQGIDGSKTGLNLITGETINLLDGLTVGPMETLIIELK